MGRDFYVQWARTHSNWGQIKIRQVIFKIRLQWKTTTETIWTETLKGIHFSGMLYLKRITTWNNTWHLHYMLLSYILISYTCANDSNMFLSYVLYYNILSCTILVKHAVLHRQRLLLNRNYDCNNYLCECLPPSKAICHFISKFNVSISLSNLILLNIIQHSHIFLRGSETLRS